MNRCKKLIAPCTAEMQSIQSFGIIFEQLKAKVIQQHPVEYQKPEQRQLFAQEECNKEL